MSEILLIAQQSDLPTSVLLLLSSLNRRHRAANAALRRQLASDELASFLLYIVGGGCPFPHTYGYKYCRTLWRLYAAFTLDLLNRADMQLVERSLFNVNDRAHYRLSFVESDSVDCAHVVMCAALDCPEEPHCGISFRNLVSKPESNFDWPVLRLLGAAAQWKLLNFLHSRRYASYATCCQLAWLFGLSDAAQRLHPLPRQPAPTRVEGGCLDIGLLATDSMWPAWVHLFERDAASLFADCSTALADLCANPAFTSYVHSHPALLESCFYAEASAMHRSVAPKTL